MKPRNLRGLRWAAATITALLLTGPVQAQQLTGTVEGKIVDSSGGVLPGVTVEMVNVATSISLNQTSRGDGTYTFNAVKPGSYLLKAALQGFQGVSLKIDVGLNKNVKADLKLAIGDLNEVVEVTDVTPTVDVTTRAASRRSTPR